MEVVVHPQKNHHPHCSFSDSTEMYESHVPEIEIILHSKDGLCASSSTSSSSSSSLNQTDHQLQVQGSCIAPSESMEHGLTRLLPSSHTVEGLEFIEVENGHLEWKEVEEQFKGSTSVCRGVNKTCNEEGLVQEMGGKAGTYYQITSTAHPMLPDPSTNSRFRISLDQMNFEGRITEEEIRQAILLKASSNKFSISNEKASEYARLVTQELDQGVVESCNFKKDHLCDASAPREPSTTMPDRNLDHRIQSSINVLLRAQWRRIWVVSVWLILCVALFTWKFMQYKRRSAFEVMGYCLCTAKGAAETLKLNMALVLFPMCRNTVTWLRKNRHISSRVPFNDNINFHKLIAGGIVIGVILHGGTHLACDFPRIAGANRSVFRQTIGAGFQHRQPSYMEILATTEGATGIAMVALMTVAFVLAARLPRRKPASLPWSIKQFVGFNAFWYSHHLFIVVYILLVVHSMFLFLTHDVTEKTTWMYIAIPVLLYAGERVLRIIRAGIHDVKVLEANIYPGKVLSLKLQKPAGFQYRSGMYIFVQCPQISAFEWHPFSLTSAPDDDYISMHIRTLGDWSYQIYSLFQEALALGRLDFPKIRIDGPYGAASQDHINYDIVMLIGLGIGATPFISILKDIGHGLQKLSPTESVCVDEACEARAPKKAYFYWVTREKSSFEWFKDIMREVSIANKKAVIEMHNYLTSVSQDYHTLVPMSAIQSLLLSKSGIEISSRVPVQMHFSRPDWVRVFSGLARRHEGERIGVFYCGSEALARDLESLCYKMTTKTATRFVFHKEHY